MNTYNRTCFGCDTALSEDHSGDGLLCLLRLGRKPLSTQLAHALLTWCADYPDQLFSRRQLAQAMNDFWPELAASARQVTAAADLLAHAAELDRLKIGKCWAYAIPFDQLPTKTTT